MRETARELLLRAVNRHRRLSATYGAYATSADDTETRMVLEHLARHEARLGDDLDRYIGEQDPEALERTFRYTPEDALRTDEVTPDAVRLPAGDLLSRAVEIDHQLIAWYRRLVEDILPIEVRQIFENLAAHEEKAAKELSRDVESLLQSQ